MSLMERYQAAVDELFAKIRDTQTDKIIQAGELMANSLISGGKVILNEICHSIEADLVSRGGGPIYYKEYKEAEHKDTLKKGDVLVVSSVSGRTKEVVDLAYEMVERGVTVIAFTSMAYATQVDPVHESGKKLYEFATLTIDNCAPAAEAMLEVDGIEARFAAASGIASNYIMWNITSATVEIMLQRGYTPGIFKSANYPNGAEYNKTVIEPHFEKYGY
ncbi:MAG: sugar isomerase domain-containing protein [Oscillospiraceae bacterium]|nr:sugar isomerase domain-containing protein [Oscillospiraceae bacterium]MBQ3224846.1 sugar isomerase domain-containing protein [Oscillospiraceae bacterium]